MTQKRLIKFGLVSLTFFVGITFFFAWYGQQILHAKPSEQAEEYLYIEQGVSLGSIARTAHQANIVNNPWHFRIAAQILGVEKRLQAGEYHISKDQNLRMTLNVIASGQRVQRSVSVAEGLSIQQVLGQLQNTYGLVLGNSEITMLEGSLMPETYVYERGDSVQSILDRMQVNQQKFLQSAWERRRKNLPIKSPEDALILASIVEKETAVPAERRLIASVFINRLNRNMRLQSDPTVIYGITQGLPLNRAITKTDLRQKTPYNTYRIQGLPPTAIANPGKASITAVLNPADSQYLYFVADGSGGHAFAETLHKHNKNVAAWRRLNRAQ